MIKAVIFDIDGTLVDSVDLHAEAWQKALKKFGCDVPFDRVRFQIGKGGDQLIPVFLSEEQINRFGKELEVYRSKLFKEDYLQRVRPFPKVRELFERILADDKRIVLATSAKEEELKTLKQIAQISDLIEDEINADDVERSKPQPDIFAAAHARLEDLPSEAIINVGDTPYDAEAALKVHLHTIGLLCGGFPEEALCASRCIAIYKDPADLLANYEQSPLVQGLYAATQCNS
jgi:HAD superfamily hydrolase (TIGR01549 family)